jgi:RecB family exonuclease
MARVWRELGTHAALLEATPGRLREIAVDAARVAVARLRAELPGRLDGRFAELERERLALTALAWLEIDRARAPFTVEQREEKMALATGGLELQGRIDRLDRLAGGGVAIIDYKTGSPSVSGWLGERPDDPQLPLYALAAGDEVQAIAFARLKAGKLGFLGLARQEGLLPGVSTVDGDRTAKKHAASWQELIEGWRETTARLAGAFAAGEAQVDPKRPFATCERCDLASLCRVRERLAGGGDDESSEGEGEDA